MQLNKDLLANTKATFRSYLISADIKENAEVSVIKLYKLFIMKEKSIYQHINYLKLNNTFFTGLLWCPHSFDI
jgi:hypothetical protein